MGAYAQNYALAKGARVLTVTLVGCAGVLGVFLGAGLVLAGMKPERELTEQVMLKLVESHLQVQALIGATQELVRLNSHLAAQNAAYHEQNQRRNHPVIVTLSDDGKVN